MRIVLCDDDIVFCEQLRKYLILFFRSNKLECPEIDLFDSGEALLKDTGDKDIIFLDAEMRGLSGIYVGDKLKKNNPNLIVFIATAYAEYLDEAMRYHVFRYLSKPIDKQRLFRNMKDAIRQYTDVNIKIAVDTKKGVHVMNMSDIVFIEVVEKKVVIHTESENYESVNNMQYWIQQLNCGCFFQSHRSFIVNLEYVTSFDNELIYLMGGKFEAYLTRRKYKEFKNAHLMYLTGRR